MGIISRFWKKLSQLGIHPNEEDPLARRRITLLAQLTFFAMLGVLVLMITNLSFGVSLLVVGQLVTLGLYVIPFLLLRNGLYYSALSFSIFLSDLLIVVQAWVLGEEIGLQYLLIITTVLPLLLSSFKPITISLVLLGMASFVSVQVIFHYQDPLITLPYIQFLYFFHIGLVFLLLLAAVSSIKRWYESIQLDMKDQGDSLVRQSEEVEQQRDQLLSLNDRLKEQNDKIQQHRLRLEKSFWDIQMLSEIGKNITAKLSIPEIAEAIYEDLSLVMPVDLFVLGIWNKDHEHVVLTEISGQRQQKFTTYTRADEHLFGIFAFNQQEAFLLNDFAHEAPLYNPRMEESPVAKPAAAVYIPLQIEEEPFGILAAHSTEKGAYTDHHMNILQNLAVFITNALENARIYGQLEVQKQEIERQNKDITDSITYASRIQKAVVDHSDPMLQAFDDAFIFYQPRDIVSGDFYWFHQRGSLRYVVAADCTGHGVAGAFLTIMGVDFLNDIVVAAPEAPSPSQILERLNQRFLKATYRRHSDRSLPDGMDVSVLVFDQDTNTVHFAGAKATLWYVRNGEIFQMKGTNSSIGGASIMREAVYEDHAIALRPGDRYYLFSDGFQDQFGGKRNKKYLKKRFRSYILSIAHLPMHEQKVRLTQELFDWMEDASQTDDILVLGLKP